MTDRLRRPPLAGASDCVRPTTTTGRRLPRRVHRAVRHADRSPASACWSTRPGSCPPNGTPRRPPYEAARAGAQAVSVGSSRAGGSPRSIPAPPARPPPSAAASLLGRVRTPTVRTVSPSPATSRGHDHQPGRPVVPRDRAAAPSSRPAGPAWPSASPRRASEGHARGPRPDAGTRARGAVRRRRRRAASSSRSASRSADRPWPGRAVDSWHPLPGIGSWDEIRNWLSHELSSSQIAPSLCGSCSSWCGCCGWACWCRCCRRSPRPGPPWSMSGCPV